MAFTDAERTDIRRWCGYAAFGPGASGFQNWRFFQAYGLLEYRMSNVTTAEEAAVRAMTTRIGALETAWMDAGANLDTDRAAVWTRNRDEVRDRKRLYDAVRRELCAFWGLPPGPGLGDGNVKVIV